MKIRIACETHLHVSYSNPGTGTCPDTGLDCISLLTRGAGGFCFLPEPDFLSPAGRLGGAPLCSQRIPCQSSGPQPPCMICHQACAVSHRRVCRFCTLPPGLSPAAMTDRHTTGWDFGHCHQWFAKQVAVAVYASSRSSQPRYCNST